MKRVILFALCSLFLLAGCQKDPQSMGVLTMEDVSNVTISSALCSGEIFSDGGYSIIERGVCWNTTGTPTILDCRTIDGGGVGSFACTVTGLTPNTEYFVRAYARTREGVFYGEQRSFSTIDYVSTTYTVNGVSFTMVFLKGGTFTMGGTVEQGSDANADELPVHNVTLESFSIGETEVTQALWQAVMGSNPSLTTGSNLPVENVSWNDVQTFLTKLNSITGQNFALPTEAEWEYAARGGYQGQGYTFSGSDCVGDVAWHIGNSSGRTQAVKSKAPNQIGLYDMSGNVWEWCQDWYGEYCADGQADPTGAADGTERVMRGGGWNSYPLYCRVSCRHADSPLNSSGFIGFRLVLR
ncbi:MAG: SUMF1/EgtB/PvdO family nonheme iron enzyme [Bacteroidales bacterium]|nr:SUMF1/EgtB/PvdO family nonheme iron enzyme [Bacteroidales bacterium]